MRTKENEIKPYPVYLGLVLACAFPFIQRYFYGHGINLFSSMGINLSAPVFEIVESSIELIITVFLVIAFVPLPLDDKHSPKINSLFITFCIGCFFLVMSKYATKAGYVIFEFIFNENSNLEVSSLPLNPVQFQYPIVFNFVAIIMAPFIEELCFRHIIFQKLKDFLSIWPSILIANLLFTLCHYPNYFGPLVTPKFFLLTAPYVFVIGLLLGIIRVKFSIWHAIALHSLINAYESSQAYTPLGIFIVLCVPFGAYFLWSTRSPYPILKS
jgi:membrane protease YdiL (CAAX protease family)